MPEQRVVRRMRRFRDRNGVEYDELPNSKLRRRLEPEDPSPLPAPQWREEIENEVGCLMEIDLMALAKRREERPRPDYADGSRKG